MRVNLTIARFTLLAALLSLLLAQSACVKAEKDDGAGAPTSGEGKPAGETAYADAEVHHIEKANRLHMRLTRGVPLLPTASYFKGVVQEMAKGDIAAAAAVITDPKNGAPEFLDNLIGSIPKSFNRDSALGLPFDEQSAIFIGVTRDNLDVAKLLTDTDTYFNPNHGIKYGEDNPRHYREIWETSSPREVLRHLPRAGFEGVGIFTSYRWMENYAQAGTNRRHVYGVMQNLFCTTLESMKTQGVPDIWVMKDIPRKQLDPSGIYTSVVYDTNCSHCHAGVIDAVYPRAFGRYNFNADEKKIEITSPVFEKLNEINSPFRAVENDTAHIWVTAAQQQIMGLNGLPTIAGNAARPMERFGNTELQYIETQGLREFAALIANSDGFYRCMSKRLVALIYMMKDYTVAGWTPEEYATLEIEAPHIQEFAQKLKQSRSLRAIAEQIAVRYTP